MELFVIAPLKIIISLICDNIKWKGKIKRADQKRKEWHERCGKKVR